MRKMALILAAILAGPAAAQTNEAREITAADVMAWITANITNAVPMVAPPVPETPIKPVVENGQVKGFLYDATAPGHWGRNWRRYALGAATAAAVAGADYLEDDEMDLFGAIDRGGNSGGGAGAVGGRDAQSWQGAVVDVSGDGNNININIGSNDPLGTADVYQGSNDGNKLNPGE